MIGIAEKVFKVRGQKAKGRSETKCSFATEAYMYFNGVMSRFTCWFVSYSNWVLVLYRLVRWY